MLNFFVFILSIPCYNRHADGSIKFWDASAREYFVVKSSILLTTKSSSLHVFIFNFPSKEMYSCTKLKTLKTKWSHWLYGYCYYDILKCAHILILFMAIVTTDPVVIMLLNPDTSIWC